MRISDWSSDVCSSDLRGNGLAVDELKISDAALRDIVRYYTRESGVRNLEREISKICRKVVTEVALAGAQDNKRKRSKGIQVTPRNLGHYLGVRRVAFGREIGRAHV